MDKQNSVVIFTTEADAKEAENKKSFLGSIGLTAAIKQYEVIVDGKVNLTMARAIIDTYRNGDIIHCNSADMDKYFKLLTIDTMDMDALVGECTMKELYNSNIKKSDFDKYVNKVTAKKSDYITSVISDLFPGTVASIQAKENK